MLIKILTDAKEDKHHLFLSIDKDRSEMFALIPYIGFKKPESIHRKIEYLNEMGLRRLILSNLKLKQTQSLLQLMEKGEELIDALDKFHVDKVWVLADGAPYMFRFTTNATGSIEVVQ